MPSQLAQRFVAFAQSDRAQQTVERIGFVSQYVEPYPALVRADAPADYRRIVRNAQRLSLNFRFGSGSSFLDSKRSEEQTSELQSLMRSSYAVFCLKKKKINTNTINTSTSNYTNTIM